MSYRVEGVSTRPGRAARSFLGSHANFGRHVSPWLNTVLFMKPGVSSLSPSVSGVNVQKRIIQKKGKKWREDLRMWRVSFCGRNLCGVQDKSSGAGGAGVGGPTQILVPCPSLRL